jgi:hypothetical protein
MVAKETLEIVEESLDPVLEASARVARWTRSDYVKVGILVQVAFVGGGILAHRFTKKKLQREYDVVLEEQIHRTKEYYSQLHKKGDWATPKSAAESMNVKASEALKDYQGVESEDVKVEVNVDEVVVNNVFTESASDLEFDYDQELSKRAARPDEPYVISEEEFMQNENDYSQQSATYYAGDGVLVDERDQPIELIDKVIGEASLERFGHGTKDKRMVYVRNDALSMDFEIAKSDGKFAHEVLGFIEHADRRPTIRKFRGDDE